MNQTIYPLSDWAFNEDVSHLFDNHVRQSVPLYEAIQQLIAQLSDFFIQPHTVVYDLGCATGETISRIHHRHYHKPVKFIGIDESEPMLQKAIRKNEGNPYIQFVQQSIEHYLFEHKSNLILSVLTMQFLPIETRKQVLQNIYSSLNKGGAFFFVEKSYPSHPKIQDMFTQIYHDEKEKQGLTATEIRDKDKSLRGVLNSLTVSDNMELLAVTGFSVVEIFFKYLNFTGFLVIK